MNDLSSFARRPFEGQTSPSPQHEPLPELGLCGGAHRIGEVIELDSGERVAVTGKQFAGSLATRTVLHTFDNGLTLTTREISMNTSGNSRALIEQHCKVVE